MITRRIFLTAFWLLACVASITVPYSLEVTGDGFKLVATAALANNGNGGGGGNGNSGGGGGNGGGNGGSSNGGDRSNSNGERSNSSSRGGAKANAKDVGIRHEGGITEEIANDRYIMKDARGRTILNRRATITDRKRIDSFLH